MSKNKKQMPTIRSSAAEEDSVIRKFRITAKDGKNDRLYESDFSRSHAPAWERIRLLNNG